MATGLFTEFGLILIIASFMSLLMRLLRQPLIIGHILTGLVVGPLVLNVLHSGEIFKFFGEIGIAFLLFTVGLSLNPRILKDYGKVALISGIGQVVITSLTGLGILLLLGFSLVSSVYISIALAFSSTIIILKLISDKGDLEKLYAKIAIGFLLVQDLIAIVLLFSIPIISVKSGSLGDLTLLLGRAVGFAIMVFLFSRYVLVRLHASFERSPEFLFLASAAWGLGIALIFRKIGMSIEAGALIAGVALSLLPSREEIHSKFIPIRDFFIVIFFVVLGAEIVLGDWQTFLFPAILLSLMVLILNPVIMMMILGVMGYRRKTSLQTGFTVAQISEFSLILVALGVSLGHVTNEELSMVTLIGIITIFGSSYLVLYSDWWYRILRPYIKIFERKQPIERPEENKSYDFVLIGGSRIGSDFIDMFRNNGGNLLVVDHDPEVVSWLETERIDYELGDAGDIDFLDSLKLKTAKLVVSTVPDFDVNLLILEMSLTEGRGPTVMAVAHSISNALGLYEAGASYVILPHFLGGKYASDIALQFVKAARDVSEIRAEHVHELEHRARRGHEHPVVERYR
ncbi:cation:proton antiporter [Candidatus Giovannonibacteria bacterium]|nr:cation:proton antiporter [Candidatus Giovannonibacteria bacterium]